MSPLAPTTAVIFALLLTPSLAIATSDSPPARFTQACKCTHCKGKARWAEKTDSESPPPSPKPEVKTVADIAAWAGPALSIKTKGAAAKRVPAEEKWYTVTGKVKLIRLEGDGDLHVQLEAAPGSPAPKSGDATYVVVEVPPNSATKDSSVADRWCNYRSTILGWTNFDNLKKPVVTKDKLLMLSAHPVITVTGKAFYDIDHAPADHAGNQRPGMPDIAVWEIHPVMDLHVENQ